MHIVLATAGRPRRALFSQETTRTPDGDTASGAVSPINGMPQR
jgi:hypothetical protein